MNRKKTIAKPPRRMKQQPPGRKAVKAKAVLAPIVHPVRAEEPAIKYRRIWP